MHENDLKALCVTSITRTLTNLIEHEIRKRLKQENIPLAIADLEQFLDTEIELAERALTSMQNVDVAPTSTQNVDVALTVEELETRGYIRALKKARSWVKG